MAKQLSTSALLLFSFLAAAAAVVTAVSGLGGGMVGGRTKVKDVKTNEEVQELGRYSVQQFNRMQKKGKKKGGGYGGDLRFQEVLEAETQVVSGVKYYLKIAAVSPGGVPKTFDAVVVVKPWAHSKELLNFDPSSPTLPSDAHTKFNG